jgi:hypothetical protein
MQGKEPKRHKNLALGVAMYKKKSPQISMFEAPENFLMPTIRYHKLRKFRKASRRKGHGRSRLVE